MPKYKLFQYQRNSLRVKELFCNLQEGCQSPLRNLQEDCPINMPRVNFFAISQTKLALLKREAPPTVELQY
jgi:hypothetical protein